MSLQSGACCSVSGDKIVAMSSVLSLQFLRLAVRIELVMFKRKIVMKLWREE